ncbi:putative DNA-binding protein (UPF0251 family) [Clostridium tetanomorphum]|uniref:UPF0251 protein HGG79_12895 n=1 Tax=Clostridium tetanomorphum TaxID=1553 RepID=A0A923J2K6_CLOTT|nr:DUF134 domain-containing protein [Clostridium tetanomorphum]KAJ51654.1 DNA-binding protein [Clostridium tetanomorphum DSM 665]KAJ51934.1 DNA-binding protein [Clostridium tetanomorphum DSM 665]MBC2398663.1 DUF134 domain-containing protein [Clostridium tetanomorphum]MBP1864057.1 putative DNA-binding protein (UPF0251 family) [Clostridium tetanomorphum]NRS84470.1 putative DNA-binding protein (UPF0251 family) [Clostridium tetanomorphum]
MSRPTKCRRVEFFPEHTYFVPLGKHKCEIEEIVLKVEELEAMRLKDIEGLNQEQCAESMQVSRQTFQNIIDSARKKIAIALTKGNAININGGNYRTIFCKFKCFNCGNLYEVNYEQDKYICPACGSDKVICSKKAEFCTKWCQGDNKNNNSLP